MNYYRFAIRERSRDYQLIHSAPNKKRAVQAVTQWYATRNSYESKDKDGNKVTRQRPFSVTYVGMEPKSQPFLQPLAAD